MSPIGMESFNESMSTTGMEGRACDSGCRWKPATQQPTTNKLQVKTSKQQTQIMYHVALCQFPSLKLMTNAEAAFAANSANNEARWEYRYVNAMREENFATSNAGLEIVD